MPNSRKITIDHNEIKQWVEKYQGKPAILDAPDAEADDVGLRINFPGSKDEALLTNAKPSYDVSWSMFFAIFEDKKLAFIYEDPSENKDLTLSYRFIRRTIPLEIIS